MRLRTRQVIAHDAWTRLHDYPQPGVAQVAETTFKDMRLIVRRVRNANSQARLLDVLRHHAFVTDRHGDPTDLDVDHWAHAVQEQVIRELKIDFRQDADLARPGHRRPSVSTPTAPRGARQTTPPRPDGTTSRRRPPRSRT